MMYHEAELDRLLPWTCMRFVGASLRLDELRPLFLSTLKVFAETARFMAEQWIRHLSAQLTIRSRTWRGHSLKPSYLLTVDDAESGPIPTQQAYVTTRARSGAASAAGTHALRNAT